MRSNEIQKPTDLTRIENLKRGDYVLINDPIFKTHSYIVDDLFPHATPPQALVRKLCKHIGPPPILNIKTPVQRLIKKNII